MFTHEAEFGVVDRRISSRSGDTDYTFRIATDRKKPDELCEVHDHQGGGNSISPYCRVEKGFCESKCQHGLIIVQRML